MKISRQNQNAGWIVAALGAALPSFLGPVYDPDLWWHLSAGRFMAEHVGVARFDWLSYTMSGAPWVDFEWIPQAVFYALYTFFGLAGLWVLKIVVLAVVGGFVWRGLFSERKDDIGARAFFLSLWAAGMVSRCDLRTELFSLAAFAGLLFVLEKEKREKKRLFGWLGAAGLFALWANCHAGFMYGLVLLAVYESADFYYKEDRRSLLRPAAAAAATLVNPFGIGVYRVLASHAADSRTLSSFIDEWGPLSLSALSHWPAWAAAAVLIFLWSRRFRTGFKLSKNAAALTMSVFVFAGALKHSRLSAYLAICAAIYGYQMYRTDKELSALLSRGGRMGIGLALLSATTLLVSGGGWRLGFFHARYVPIRAAEFLDRHPELTHLRMYNVWGWGGYLGWRLGTKTKVFQDGRYLFHPLLAQAGAAAKSSARWSDFLNRHDIQLALLQNRKARIPFVRVYPDGSQEVFKRPYYLFYMPKKDWALIYWDEKTLLFVKRSAIGEERMPADFELLRPGDEEIVEDAASRGEIDADRLRREALVHRRQMEDLGGILPGPWALRL